MLLSQFFWISAQENLSIQNATFISLVHRPSHGFFLKEKVEKLLIGWINVADTGILALK